MIVSMQAGAEVTKKESSWSGWRGQGTDVFTVLTCVSAVAVRDGLLFLHAGYLAPHPGVMFTKPLFGVCVCVCIECASIFAP